MVSYIILAQSETTAYALGAWLELLGEPPVNNSDDERLIIWQDCVAGGFEKSILYYESMTRRIEEWAPDKHGTLPLNEVVVLVDTVRPKHLNPLSVQNIYAWEILLAMLILTFPEIRWVFGIGAGINSDEFDTEYHSLFSLFLKPRRDPLFDATGLRNSIRYKIAESLLTETEKINPAQKILMQTKLPIRTKKAAAIDEENNYAIFHAYTAYRFGYRSDAIRSWTLMEYLFGAMSGCHDFDLLLEDVNISFPDQPEYVHLSSFRQYNHESHGETGRAKHCPLLGDDPSRENSKFRIIVSSGHSGTDAERMRDNIDFLMAYNPEGWGFVTKPVGGMFDLWHKARLFSRLDPQKGSDTAGRYRGQAPGFNAPPEAEREAEDARKHSAPGKLMLIAENLVRRADALLNSSNTVEECIRGAVLATDALELLRYQTPTLALQALSLKHEFEVRAEVAFLGVGYHFELDKRLDELERDVKAASRYFQKERRRAAELDTLVSIGNRMMLVFRNAGQFDEEQKCLARIRFWHRKLQRSQVRNPLDFVAQWIMTYAEWLLASPRRFMLALIGWYLLFWGLWYGLIPVKEGDLFWQSASSAWNTFIAANPASPDEKTGSLVNILNVFASALGLFHLGVFISYIYSVVTRK